MEDQISDYVDFIQNLETALLDLKRQQQGLLNEVGEYNVLENKVSAMIGLKQNDVLSTSVDLGEGIHVQAVVPAHSSCFVHIGMDIFIEIPVSQVGSMCSARRFLLIAKSRVLKEKIASISSDLDQVIYVQAIQSIDERCSAPEIFTSQYVDLYCFHDTIVFCSGRLNSCWKSIAN
jgi:prefoldin subunit 5